MLGSFAIALGLFISLLVIPAIKPVTLLGIVCPLAVGGTVATLGLLMLYVGLRSTRT